MLKKDMKNSKILFWIIILMIFVLAILSSCKKDPVTTPTYIITPIQLNGNWETVQYVYNGDTLLNDSIHTTACLDAYYNTVTHGKGLIFIQLNKVDSISHTCLISDCTSINTYTYQLLPDKINFTLIQTSSIDLTFDILNYNDTILILKLTASQYPQYLIGSIYTLKRIINQHIISPLVGKWINDYVLINNIKDTMVQRFQFQFNDTSIAIITSANDTSIHKVYDHWIVFGNLDKIELVNENECEIYDIVQKPFKNKMILQIYNYKYCLTKVKIKK